MPGWPRVSCSRATGCRSCSRPWARAAGSTTTGLTVTAGDRLDGLDADLADCTELVPALVALAALARTPSTLRGIGHMRGHGDRPADRAGHRADPPRRRRRRDRATGCGSCRGRLHGGTVRTYHDHRIAMFGAVLGLAVPGVLVEDVATTGKTVPDFADRWVGMLGTAPAGAAH